MARLEGITLGMGPRWFSLEPVPPICPDDDATDFTVQISPGPDGGTYTRTFSTVEWFTGQTDVFLLARAFSETTTLVALRTPISLFPTGRGVPATLFEETDNIGVALHGHPTHQWIIVRIFVRERDDDYLYRRFVIRTSVAQASQFGRELEQEIIAACPRWVKEDGWLPTSQT